MDFLQTSIILFLVTGTLCQMPETNIENSHVEVEISQGAISGERMDAGNGRFIYAFKSIPYAKPPVGKLRFKDPSPADGWTGVRNGSATAPECPQMNLTAIRQGKINLFGQEDCLYLNVYTPRPTASDLPVIVFIHGGAFFLGDVTDRSPLPLLTEDIVLVTFHYRIGTLAFLSTEDEVMPGNLGLKDQTLALRWVKDNIQHFGGNPNEVTIYGISAGAASVQFQILSPYAKGLFKRAILQSGSALTTWSLRKDHKEVALKAAKTLRCTGAGENIDKLNSTALLLCLQTIPMEQFVSITMDYVVWSLEPQVMMPRIDGDFLPADPALLMKEGRYNEVDLITGITADDGDITTKFIYGLGILRNLMVQNFFKVGPLVLNFRDGDENPEYLARRVFHHYLGGVKINNDNADNVTRLFTHALFGLGNDRTAQLHARNSTKNVFMYEFHHRGEHSYYEVPDNNVTKKWIGHADDRQYLFESVSGVNPMKRPDDLMVRHILVKLWTNFARTGNPTPDQSLGFRWLPVKNDCLKYLRIAPEAKMEDDYRAQDRAFWDDLPTVQNKILYPEKFQTNYTEPSDVSISGQ